MFHCCCLSVIFLGFTFKVVRIWQNLRPAHKLKSVAGTVTRIENLQIGGSEVTFGKNLLLLLC